MANEENELEEEFNPEHIKTRIKRNKQERHVRKTNMWMRRLRMLLRFLFILSLMLLCFKLIRMRQWYMSPKAFDSADSPYLEITNNKIVPTYYIIAALRKSEVPKVPIYMYNTDEIEENLKSLPPVENVYIRRFWFPARLQIIIQEDIPSITIAPDEKVPPIAFFSSDGKLIGRDYMPLSPDFKAVRVITYGSGDDYRNWDKTKISNFKKLAATVEMDSGEAVEYIDYRNPRDVYVKIPTANIRLGSFNAGTYDKIHRIPSLLPQVKMLNKKVKYIDLRWDTNYIKLDE